MAIFYFVGKKDTAINWKEFHDDLFDNKIAFLTIFPIPYEFGMSGESVGITASGKFANSLKEVKAELQSLFKWLWDKDFVIVDLYKGKEITLHSFSTDLDYF